MGEYREKATYEKRNRPSPYNVEVLLSTLIQDFPISSLWELMCHLSYPGYGIFVIAPKDYIGITAMIIGLIDVPNSNLQT